MTKRIITPFDIRLKYRFDTGEAPTYGKDEDHFYNYKGSLTHEYAEWLEELLCKALTASGK
jgi:hypothetical protein